MGIYLTDFFSFIISRLYLCSNTYAFALLFLYAFFLYVAKSNLAFWYILCYSERKKGAGTLWTIYCFLSSQMKIS